MWARRSELSGNCKDKSARKPVMSAQMPRPKVVEWCRRCRAKGLDSPLQLFPMGRNEAIRMCSNLNCSDEVNGNITSELIKIEVMSILHEFHPGLISVTDKLSNSDSDEEFDYHCRKVSSHNALVTAKPLGEPSVGIGDSTSTTAVCVKPSVYANSSEHVYRECQTSTSTCGDAGQAFIAPVVEPIVSSCDSVSCCANHDVCMDTEEPTDSASLCADFSLCEGDEEPWSNIFDCELPCADNVCMDAEEPTDTSDNVLLCADYNVSVDTGESTSNICDNTSACADSKVYADMKEHVYRTPQNSAITCGDANVTADKEEVGGVSVPDSVQTLSFSAHTSLHASSHEHGSRSRDALHIPITAVKTTVRVTASSDPDLDDSPMTPSSHLSAEAKTRKWIHTGDGHTFYTSLMPKAVAVKVVASSERPLCLSKAESPIAIPCLEKKKEECVEKTSRLFNLHRMEKVLNVKIVASSEVEPGLCNNVSTPTLLPPNGTNSWLEVLPEELEDEVNHAVHEVVQEPAAHSVSAHDLESTNETIVIGSPSLQLDTQRGDVKCKDVLSSPVTSPISLVMCRPERERSQRANVSPVDESMSKNSEGHLSVGVATESAYSTCTAEDASMEWSDKENVVAVSTACVTNAAFSSTAALGAMDVENTFLHDGCNRSSRSASLSTLSQEQEAISATVCDFTDSFEHCDDGSGMPSTEGLPENDQRAGETPKLPEPLQEIGADAGPTTSHEPDVVDVAINSPSQLDRSEVVQECCYQEEQSCTIAADQQTVVAKKSSAEVLSQPTSEASFVENHEIASELESLSTEPPKLLEIQTYGEASLSETFAVAGGTAPLEVPMSSKEPWRSTENVHCYHDLDASTCAPCGLPSLEGKSEGGLPPCPGATNAAPSTELARPVLKESNIQGSSLGKATSETISLPQASCNEQAGIEGVLMHDGSFLSSAASYCSSSPSRSEVYSPEGSVVASETYSVGLVEPSQTAHGDNSRTVTNHPASSAIPNAITEPTVVSSGISAPGPVEDSLEGPLEDPLAASLSIAESMSNIGHHYVVLQGPSAEDSSTNASLTQKLLPLQSSGLNVKHYTVLKGDVGGEGGCLSLTATAPHQRPACSLKRTRSPSPSATLSTTVRPSSHAGGGSGTLQQCMSTALLLPSTSALSNKPSSSDVQEGEVTASKRARWGCEAMKVTIGTTTTGKAVVFCVSGLQKSVQNVVLKLPSNVVTGGDTQTAAVHPVNKRARAQNARTKQQEQVESTVASKGHKSKTTEEKKKSPLPPKKVSRTGFAAVDKLAAINEALAVPMASESAPKKSKVNARAKRQSGRTCPNKKERQPKKWQIALPKKAKQVSSIKRKGGAPNEQVVPDMGPVLSPTSSDLSSISSKPSKSSFSGTSYNAASSISTSKTGNSWRSNRSFKSAEEYVEAIKNRRFPMEESGSGFPGYHTVLATRPPYKRDKKSTVIAPKRRRTKAVTPARPTTEAASATVGAELDRYVSELSASTDVSHYDNVLSELFDSTA